MPCRSFVLLLVRDHLLNDDNSSSDGKTSVEAQVQE